MKKFHYFFSERYLLPLLLFAKNEKILHLK